MSERLRLRDVDPEALAATAAQGLVELAGKQLLAAPKLTEAIAVLARYARGEGLPAGVRVADLLDALAPLYRSVVHPTVTPLDFIEVKPSSPLALVVAAAVARMTLDAGGELTCTELALLTGIHRDHLTTRASSIPGAYRQSKAQDPRRPWRFRPSADLRKWIRTNAM